MATASWTWSSATSAAYSSTRGSSAIARRRDRIGKRREATAVIEARAFSSRSRRFAYAQRKQTIEPVFGISEAAMGFRRLSLRGLFKVRTEWTLVTLADNLQRLFHVGADLAAA